MSLVERYIDGYVVDKVKTSIERLKNAYQISQARGLGPLYVCYSGGKDSVVIAELAKRSGVSYELHYNITGIDPPEVVYFMRENYNAIDAKTLKPIRPRREGLIDLHYHMYEKSMWKLIVEKHIPPTRIIRYCCSELKEGGGKGRMCVTGVRWAESVRRKNTRTAYELHAIRMGERMLFNDNDDRRMLETCMMKQKIVCNPIIDWEDEDVWEFIRCENLPYCSLYDEGKTRIGCIGCPMQGPKGMKKDFERYPKFKELYIRAFDRMLENMDRAEWKSGEEVFEWWTSKTPKKVILPGQVGICESD